jgi:UDP-glucose 4-epimerase
MRVLVCGGAGFIGSHTCVVLAEHGHEVVIVDSHVNSSPKVLQRIEALTGSTIPAYTLDLRDSAALAEVFCTHRIDAVVHFAALKAVGESCEQPLRYFDNNIGGTISLLNAMRTAGVGKVVFSSSATVYGEPDEVPIREGAPLRATNPYARSKLIVEQILSDICHVDKSFHAACLRYFNPVGAHPSGTMGEDPVGTPNNLMPFVCQVAVGRRASVQVFGGDYPTHDGTGVRDYVHVMDLARAHVTAIDYLMREQSSLTVNLGTGKAASVLDVVRTFERIAGRAIPCQIVDRRPGDVATLYADPSLAWQLLGWRAMYNLDEMCRDSWNWQSKNLTGYT